jgi:hypothetical protein
MRGTSHTIKSWPTNPNEKENDLPTTIAANSPIETHRVHHPNNSNRHNNTISRLSPWKNQAGGKSLSKLASEYVGGLKKELGKLASQLKLGTPHINKNKA